MQSSFELKQPSTEPSIQKIVLSLCLQVPVLVRV